MAQSLQTGDTIVTADSFISDLLSAPLGPDWTVDCLAEQVLCAVATRCEGEAQEFVLDADTLTDRQSRRILRPLLACLANKSATEAGTAPNLYCVALSFQRPGHEGPVWISGRFENSPSSVRLTLRRSSTPPQISEPTTGAFPAAENGDTPDHAISAPA
jgi:hypothetical protein